MFHDHETAGHPGELETYNSVAEYYWWPGLRSFVKNYVKGCGICQQFKIDRHPSHPSYLPIPGAQTTRPFANCSMDFITVTNVRSQVISHATIMGPFLFLLSFYLCYL